MTIREKCSECGKSISPYSEITIGDKMILVSREAAKNICAACLSRGWVSDSQKVYESLMDDPELSKAVRFEPPKFDFRKKLL